MSSKILFLLCLMPSVVLPMSWQNYLCGYCNEPAHDTRSQQMPYVPNQRPVIDNDNRQNYCTYYYDSRTGEVFSEESSCYKKFKIFMTLSGATICWTTGTITLPLSCYYPNYIPLSVFGWIGAIAFTKMGVAQLLQACSEDLPTPPDPDHMV